MALRSVFGFTDVELMRADCKPCSTLMKHTDTIFTVGGGIGFWIAQRTRMTLPRTLRWATCGAVSVSSTTALLVRLFMPECEPQNIAAYDSQMKTSSVGFRL
ncbi:hypothetical protein CKAN_02288600 [Cinnamomum micranthum f. kanehirae]|uniref:DUF7875 domain-containing protein n=1 Tax=Cinnamomum micranthum f. kanehirae TaxID=337451 RepID=A0A443PSD0_9MAGN|nr:hypothetical protein CKAN_02288600 [Cinnamomum micranthum f. kanehirae]